MLFGPVTIGTTTLRNRFALPAMQRGWAADYAPSERMTRFYRNCVNGGTSLIITESAAIDHPSATWQSSFVLMLSDRTADEWRKTIKAVKDAGGTMLIQLWHEGAIRKEGAGGPYPDAPTLSPSGLIQEGRANGRAATPEELDEIRRAFVDSAVMAKELGADGVEIHSAHGYFLDQFLWPQTNRRTDKYGGDILARSRFAAEIVADIRAKTGDDFIIGLRFSQWKEVDYAAKIVESPQELRLMVEALEQAGVDLFHVSTRRFYEPEWPDSPLGIAGWTKSFCRKAAVMANGSVGVSLPLLDTFQEGLELEDTASASIAELQRRIGAGEFDMASVGRANIADPDWVNKAQSGRFDQIRPFKREMLQEALAEWDADLIEEVLTDIQDVSRSANR